MKKSLAAICIAYALVIGFAANSFAQEVTVPSIDVPVTVLPTTTTTTGGLIACPGFNPPLGMPAGTPCPTPTTVSTSPTTTTPDPCPDGYHMSYVPPVGCYPAVPPATAAPVPPGSSPGASTAPGGSPGPVAAVERSTGSTPHYGPERTSKPGKGLQLPATL